jgi:hypothetical protein
MAEPIRTVFPREAPPPPPPPPPGAGWMKPFVWREPETIPMRQWLYGGHYIRKFITTTMAPGGLGKSALAILEALCMATGKPLLGVAVPQRLRVWYFNGEDPLEETERRIAAAAKHYALTPSDIEGWLFIGSGRDSDLILATQTRDGIQINEPHAEALGLLFNENQIDLAIVDPFVSSHQVTENDNGAINTVVKRWAGLAESCNVGVDLIHHMRKRPAGSGDAELSVEDGRGAVALLSAARSARVLNGMSGVDAEKAGIENRRSYFKVDNGKANLAPPPEKSEWRRFSSVDLGNGGGLADGDSVGVVVAWEWPDHTKGLRAEDTQSSLVGAYRLNLCCQIEITISQGGFFGLSAVPLSDKRPNSFEPL